MTTFDGPWPDVKGSRLERGWTVARLASECKATGGVSVSASEISRIERHIHAPRPELRKALADLLGLDVRDFPDQTPTRPASRTRTRDKPGTGTPGTNEPKPRSDRRATAGNVAARDSVRCLALDQGTKNALMWAGATTVADVARLIENADLERVRGIGAGRYAQIERVLRAAGFYPSLSPCRSGEDHPIAETCLVRCLGVTSRTVNALKRADTRTITETLRLIETETLAGVRGLGGKSREELQSALVETGFQPWMSSTE